MPGCRTSDALKGLNNRAENSHLPFRKRERMRQGFRSLWLPSAFRLYLLRGSQSLRPSPAQTDPPAQIRNPTAANAMAAWKAVALQIA